MNNASSRKWTADEIAVVRDYYTNTPSTEFRLNRIAQRLGRGRISVALKASRLGLGDRNRPSAFNPKFTQPELPWSKWVKFPHPRGMKGKKHKPEVLQAVSDGSRRYWERCKRTRTGHMAKDARQKRSDNFKLMNQIDPRMAEGYTRCKGGRRADLNNVYYRSAWEANIARYLNWQIRQGLIHRWEYEADTFEFRGIQRGTRTYTPDFKIWEKPDSVPYFIEVKGWMDQKSRTRMKRMKKYHPAVRVDLLGQKRYAVIASQMSRLILGWE